MRLIAIDPGHTTGFAAFQDGVLTHAGTGLPDLVPDELVVEKPEYQGRRAPVRDLIELTIRAGCAFSAYPGARRILIPVSKWKGSINKTVHHGRILKALAEHERAVIPRVRVTKKNPLGHDNNTLDAIGLGLFALNRMRKGGA